MRKKRLIEMITRWKYCYWRTGVECWVEAQLVLTPATPLQLQSNPAVAVKLYAKEKLSARLTSNACIFSLIRFRHLCFDSFILDLFFHTSSRIHLLSIERQCHRPPVAFVATTSNSSSGYAKQIEQRLSVLFLKNAFFYKHISLRKSKPRRKI
ncbi:unnamed protein product [Ceratitis capitata]|uniref:(Mediterranean fruit fly) hypothetical protein n=1 Tax=Ceratitis capitata TaxID=7213 RepID=A0A811V6F2_CERCA|nr:unnamed protein product [Ceratitis capitata]